MMINKIFAFVEVPPNIEKGFGLSVFTYNFFSEIINRVECVFTYETKTIKKSDNQKTYINDKLVYLGFNSSFRSKIIEVVDIIKFITFDIFIIIKKLKENPNFPILFFIGSSANILLKIFLISLFTKNSIWLYIVDEYEGLSIKKKRYITKKLFLIVNKHLIINADNLIFISQGLKDYYEKKFGKKSTVVYPTYQKTRIAGVISDKKNFNMVFTGGLSILYNDTLQFVAESIKQINQNYHGFFNLTIQTYTSYAEFCQVFGENSYIEYNSCTNRNDIIATYEKADCFIIPYSFREEFKSFVQTSFPQKIAEIIQYERPIFVIAPEYSSIYDYFAKNELLFRLQSLDFDMFMLMLNKIKVGLDNHNLQKYKKTYDIFLSPKNIIKLLNNEELYE